MKIAISISKIVVVILGIWIFTGLIYFPQIEGRNVNSDWLSLYFNDPFLAYIYIGSIPFFVGLYHIIKLLGLIEKKTFAKKASPVLQNIQYCALLNAGFILGAFGFLFMMGVEEDITGVLVLGSGAILIALSIALTIFLTKKHI